MTMNWKIFAVCLFAVAASYLIVSLPVASAAQVTVTISYGGSSSQSTTYNPDAYITRHVSVDGATGDVRVQVSNGSSVMIDSVYVYKCQARDPSACSSQVTAVSYGGNTDIIYPWNDVSDAAHQTANIMVVVHTIDAGGGRWLSFWGHGAKTAGSPYTMIDSSIGSIAITAKDISYVPNIKSFIDTKGMLPMNPLWISSITLTGVTNFHDIESSSPPAANTQTYYTGSSITNLTGSYAFIFPYNGVYTLNGITVASSPNFITGDGVCSAGEPSDLQGCIDCGTDPGYYCDVIRGQKQLNSISLSTSTGAIKVSNCNVPNTISLSFTIGFMPSGTTLTGAQYSLNGSAAQPSVCTQSGNIFTCSITTPAVPGCTGTDYVLNPNSMAFSIRFNNGSSYMTKTISSSIPQITVGSWTCGQFGCESSIGENSANCCHDCVCAAGQYCDFATAHPETSSCKSPITDSNMELVSISPPSFYTHNPVAGDTASVGLHITNAPQSLLVSSSGCRVAECFNSTSPSTGLPCAASCTASCTKQASSNPNLYNESCAVNFRIAGYNPLQNYTLYTVINNTLSYNNGTGSQISSVLETISQNKPIIHVGAHFQGDGICDPDESFASVCYDCPCPAGQYCDSSSRVQFTSTDTCRLLSGISIALDSTGTASFTDSSLQHSIGVAAHVDSNPHGVSAAGSCSFNNSIGAPACTMACSTNETANGYNISCGIVVPVINYKTSAFYNSTTRRITLPSSSFSMSFFFNNGSRSSYRSANFSLPNVTIDVVPHCGDSACDIDIGETSATCCLDCTCSAGMFCYNGTANGRCLNASDISLAITGTKPPDLSCTIAEYKGKCQFIKPVDIYAGIINTPANALLMSSYYRIDGKEYDINCFASPVGQNSRYICSTALPEIAGDDGGATGKQLDLYFTIRYSNNGTFSTRNISASTTLSINRIKSDKVVACEQAIQEAKKAKDKIGSKKDMLNIFLAITGVIAAFTCSMTALCCGPGIFCWVSCGWWLILCGLALMLVGCIGGMLNSALEQAKQAAAQAEQKKEQLCASSDPASMKSAAQGAKDSGSSGLGAALGIICAIGVVVGMIGAFMLMSAAAPAAGGITGVGPEGAMVAGTETAAAEVPAGTTVGFAAGSEGALVDFAGIQVPLGAGGALPAITSSTGGTFTVLSGSGTITAIGASAPGSLASIAVAGGTQIASSIPQSGGGSAATTPTGPTWTTPPEPPSWESAPIANPTYIGPDYTVPAVTPSAAAPYDTSSSAGGEDFVLPPVKIR